MSNDARKRAQEERKSIEAWKRTCKNSPSVEQRHPGVTPERKKLFAEIRERQFHGSHETIGFISDAERAYLIDVRADMVASHLHAEIDQLKAMGGEGEGVLTWLLTASQKMKACYPKMQGWSELERQWFRLRVIPAGVYKNGEPRFRSQREIAKMLNTYPVEISRIEERRAKETREALALFGASQRARRGTAKIAKAKK